MECSIGVDTRELCHMLVLCQSCRPAPGRNHCWRALRLATTGCARTLGTRLLSLKSRKLRTLRDGKLQSSRRCLLSGYRRPNRSRETNRCCWKSSWVIVCWVKELKWWKEELLERMRNSCFAGERNRGELDVLYKMGCRRFFGEVRRWCDS